MAKLPFVINDGKWHHICIAWTTRDGVWEAYQDGVLRGNGENLAPYHPIKHQGVLVIGQEQVITPRLLTTKWCSGLSRKRGNFGESRYRKDTEERRRVLKWVVGLMQWT